GRVEAVGEVGGQTVVTGGERVPVTTDRSSTAGRRRLEVIPPVSLRFTSSVELFAPGAARPAIVELTAARARAGTLQLTAPAGWTVTPASQPFHLSAAREHARFRFRVTAPGQPPPGPLHARATSTRARVNA